MNMSRFTDPVKEIVPAICKELTYPNNITGYILRQCHHIWTVIQYESLLEIDTDFDCERARLSIGQRDGKAGRDRAKSTGLQNGGMWDRGLSLSYSSAVCLSPVDSELHGEACQQNQEHLE